MKNFILGGLFVIGIAYLGCYMYEAGHIDACLKLGRYYE